MLCAAGFQYDKAVHGFIKDWKRVFHQGDTYHRGTLTAPGRTVTLEHVPGAVTWGTAFRLSGTRREQEETLQVQDACMSMRVLMHTHECHDLRTKAHISATK